MLGINAGVSAHSSPLRAHIQVYMFMSMRVFAAAVHSQDLLLDRRRVYKTLMVGQNQKMSALLFSAAAPEHVSSAFQRSAQQPVSWAPRSSGTAVLLASLLGVTL